MDTFSLIIDSLRKNDPAKARTHLRELMRSGNLAQEHWTAVYGALRLTTLAIEGRGYRMLADTRKAWWGYCTEQALENLSAHLELNPVVQVPAKSPFHYVNDKNTANMDDLTLIMDSLRKNDPIAARKQMNIFMRSGKLTQKDWPTLHSILLLITKAIDGRGDYMYADTRKAWLTHYTAQALDELRTYLGLNEVIQFPVEATSEAIYEAA